MVEAQLPPMLTVVVPCYNEEEVLEETCRQLDALLADLVQSAAVSASSMILFVDDGSQDSTWSIIDALSQSHGRVNGLKLSRNRGHQNALMAGLLSAPGDVVVSIDADLQDDVSAVGRMVEAHAHGAEIVYGVRKSRKKDGLFKRSSAEGYYKLLNRLGVNVVFNHADYRLMSRKAVEALRGYGEANLFLRGIVPELGFTTAIVEYDRAERFAGESKYPLSKMLSLAMDGVTSFTISPLRAITSLGFTISILSFVFGLWALIASIMGSNVVPGWTSIVAPMFFLGGIQLLSIGVLGEYVGKIYLETKQRPRFIIETTSGDVRLGE